MHGGLGVLGRARGGGLGFGGRVLGRDAGVGRGGLGVGGDGAGRGLSLGGRLVGGGLGVGRSLVGRGLSVGGGLIGRGLTNEAIAQTLFLSPNSIKSHIRSAYRKICVERRSQAVKWVHEHGLRLDTLALPGPAA